MRPCPGAYWGVADYCYRWISLVWGPVHPVHTLQKRAAGGARLDWRWQGRARFGLGLGSDGCSSGEEEHATRAACCQRATGCEHAQWAECPGWAGGQVGRWALGRKPLPQRAVARPVASSLKRGLGGAAVWAVNLGALRRGARAPPFFLPSFQNTTAETLSSLRRKEPAKPSRQRPSRTLALMANTVNKGPAHV